MQALSILGLSVITLAFYLGTARGDCGTVSKLKMDGCVAVFSTANLDNRSDRKARIDAGNTTCPTDILKGSCESFGKMMGCVNIDGFPWGCEGEFNTELTNQDFQCTFLELGALCPDAETISGATSVAVSFTLVAMTLAAAIFNRL